MKIAENIINLVGNTPLLKVNRYIKNHNLQANLLAKVEFFNPAGSSKDRVAVNMIDDAERKGLIKPGATIIEPTSGNTGVGLALVSAVKGYKLILTMPDTMSVERIKLASAYGAKVELTPGSEGMKGAIERAEQLNKEIEGSIILQQFDNPANPQAHYLTTANEIWRDTDGQVDIFVATIGTGGTISGTARRLKELNPAIKIIGVEPASSPLLTKGYAASHKIQGIGANFIPKIYDATLVDDVIAISDDDAFQTAKELAQTEGLFVGISSGAAMSAALKVAEKESENKNIVVLLPDTGERYLSVW
ncbi:MAG: cysteine synthase A [Prevotellaceae bacterium]|nr:cysteine synthase A [Candidatus Faecinaster equi]